MRSLPLFLALALSPALAAPSSNPRDAAQRGVHFLARSTADWQRQNNCYGCHVQAVTLEGLSVAKQNQYDVPAAELKVIVDGLLFSSGGARTPTGLSHSGFPRTAKTFGGAAFARYDQYMGSKLRDDLVKLARELLAFQQKDGSVTGDHQSYPVTTGVMQSTYQAMQTWRQVYARTADDLWLSPIRRAEGFIATRAAQWEGNPKGVYLQDVNYALMGLVSAGVTRSEGAADRLVRFLLSTQNEDGGFGFSAGTSDPFATGQTVYALRLAGLSETDAKVARGIRWLVSHQQENGSWGAGGSGKAEAMWAVMGLVSVDVVSVSLAGVNDGEHVSPEHALEATAKDNQGHPIREVELFVDDLSIAKAAGGTLRHAWKTGGLTDGKHVLDVVATNVKGQTSRRRYEVYAGNVFITSLATRFGSEGTQVSVRNIGAAKQTGSVMLTVRKAEVKDGQPSPGAEVYRAQLPGTQGAMGFVWGGKGVDGKPLPNGRYYAEVAYVEGKAVLQTERALFTHDTPERQRAEFGEISGGLGLAKRAGMGAANARVDLIDASGKVVQSVQSNEEGQYRFKSVDKGNYRVRVQREGFKAVEAPAAAAPASESKADLRLE